MKTRARFDRSRAARRGAFTLMELMIVIIIIAALMALLASAVFKFLESQQISNTQSTLDRVQSQLAKAWSKVKDQAEKESIPPAIASWIQQNLTFPSNDPNAAGRIRVIYVKLKLRQAFPMSFNEALFPPALSPTNVCPMMPLPAYQQYLGSLQITGSSAASSPYESSACLLMALQRGVSGAGIDPSQLTTGGAAGSYTTPNGGSLPYLTDAWSRPIYFTRAPAGCLNLNPLTSQSVTNTYNLTWGTVVCYSQPGNNDPLDPQGFLQTPNWGTTYGPSFTTVTSQVIATGNSSFKLAPIVASGGPTNWMKTGTTPPFDPITFYTISGSGVQYGNLP